MRASSFTRVKSTNDVEGFYNKQFCPRTGLREGSIFYLTIVYIYREFIPYLSSPHCVHTWQIKSHLYFSYKYMRGRSWKVLVFTGSLTFIAPSRERLRSTFIRRNFHVHYADICISRKPGAHSSNVKILPVLFSMIIPHYLQKERTFDESTISTSMAEKGSSLLLSESAIYSGYLEYVRSKSGDLWYTKESLPYFVQHCAPRLFDRKLLFDLP